MIAARALDDVRPGSQYCPPLPVTFDHCRTCGDQLVHVADDRPLDEITVFRGRRFTICRTCEPWALEDDS